MIDHRALGPADAPALLAFLDEHLDSSLFLAGNAETAGLEDGGGPLHGRYVAALRDGTIVAIAAHYGNGFLMVQGDDGLEQAVLMAIGRSGRPVHGIIGPLPLVERARVALGMQERAARKDEPEILYSLRLDRLKLPALLSAPGVTCRPPTLEETGDVLVDWQVSYAAEALGAERTPALRDSVRDGLARSGPVGWILVDGGRPVSYSRFTVETRGVVQVGNVFTPPALRGRGYGRAVVAGSLLDARTRGVTRSVLFTARTNVAAQRAYTSLGYEMVGLFGLVVFA